jgi:hypothetical protein
VSLKTAHFLFSGVSAPPPAGFSAIGAICEICGFCLPAFLWFKTVEKSRGSEVVYVAIYGGIMYQQFSATTEAKDQVEIIRLKGYLEDTGGTLLKQTVQAGLDAGFSTEVELISSPGVAAMLDIAGLIADDFAGLISVWGLDKHHSTVLEMSGFFFMAHQATNEQESIDFLTGGG